MKQENLAELIMWSGLAFLVVALLIGVATALQALEALRAQARAEREAAAAGVALLGGRAVAVPASLPTLTEALGKLVEALAKAPAWFTLYLGGFALLYLSVTLVKG